MYVRMFIALAITFSLIACGYVDRAVVTATGNATETCVDGVAYLQFTSGASVKYNLEGKPVACRK